MYRIPPVLLAAAIALLLPFESNAQVSTFIGSSSFTKQQFSCVTYPGGEDVTVTTKGKERIIEKAEAKRMVDNAIQKVTRKTNDTKADLRETKQLLKRLLNSPLLALPKTAKQVEQAKKRIARLEKLLVALKGQKDELKSLGLAIADCGKIPPLTNGSNTIKSGTIDLPLSGWQGYLISAMHVFAYHPSFPDRICVSVNGGPKRSVGIQFTACTNFNDGPGTGKPVSYCLPTLPANSAAILLGGKANYFHLGTYDDDMTAVQKFAEVSVELSLPSASNPCPR